MVGNEFLFISLQYFFKSFKFMIDEQFLLKQ